MASRKDRGNYSVWEEPVERAFEISHLPEGAGIKLTGNLDLQSAHRLSAALKAFQEVDEVCIDMTQVTFVDSSGLNSILSFARSRDGKGRIVIVDPAAVIGPVFNLIALDDHVCIEVLTRRGDGDR